MPEGCRPMRGFTDESMRIVGELMLHASPMARQMGAERRSSFSSWLWQVYQDYLDRITPACYLNHDGRVQLEIRSPALEELEQHPPRFWPPFLQPDTPYVFEWQTALFWFIRFHNEGDPALLERCRYCGVFFVRERASRKGREYKRGSCCSLCTNRSAKDRKDDQRSTAKAVMIAVAAKAWLAWKKRNRTSDRYQAVAARVTRDCAKQCEITVGLPMVTRKWVRQNEQEIVAFIQNSEDLQSAERKD